MVETIKKGDRHMGMNIMVMSPHYEHRGVTTIASMIAIELANSGRKVCLTHTSTESKSMYSYFDFTESNDKTADPVRLAKMIKEDVLKPEEISDYCKGVNERLEVFSVKDEDFEESDMNEALKFILGSESHEFVIVDSDVKDINYSVNVTAINNADVIILVINQDSMELETFSELADKIMSRIGGIPTLVVINRYHPAMCTIKQAASVMGVGKPNSWYTMRFNPCLARIINFQQLSTIDKILYSTPELMDVQSDVKTITGAILKVKVAKRKALLEKRRQRGK